MTHKTWLAVSLICVLAISALFDGLFYWHGVYGRPVSAALADTVSTILLVMWIMADQRDHPQVERPFDYGFLLSVFWVPYLPYYLWRTRRVAGLWMFAGFLGLFSLSFLVQVAIWMVLATNNQFFAVPR
ncbi:hypothetical protein [Bradyrhizobium sp. OK095]|jgi:hypothetical protein|uniref:hypothetical protein n=1 Tax=Bradyrhizobium sp. OK095 TaxID=1882760 RepID=UPI0008D6438A|nr:hypothetical protein [Bradyrhizobium sp. OK095]SEN02396.1 hypothetical protein SAMN05443254_105324 [Bradyrhizobium sp. OK095]